MPVATLTFSSPQWLWPALGIVGFVAVALWWSYRSPLPRSLRWSCILLKMLAVALLAFCLLEPLWTRQRAKPGSNLFVIVADNSEGLKLKDQGASETRGEQLQKLLGADAGDWQAILEDNFELRRFVFDSRLQASRDFGELNFDGRSSAMGAALRGIRDRFEGRPVAGVLLLTDGNATDLTSAPPESSDLPPVYPVVMGRAGGARDAAIGQVHVTQTAFEDAPVTIHADVTANGLRGETLVASLLDQSGHQIRETTLRARKNEETLSFQFQFRPEKPGLSFYRLHVALPGESGPGTTSNESREATLLNNTRVVAVDRGRGPYRILYVGGRPNWEYKFLNRAVTEDDQVQLVALIRAARREGKFEFRGRGGETSNPLYRGFGDQSREEVERYDEPVIVRLNTRDEEELSGGFPSVPEDLYKYQALILDDVEAAFFKTDQATLVQKFVSERGGGLLMLGGMESFQNGGFARTPIGDMLPVYLNRGETASTGAELRLNLSREGWLQAWARLRDNESDEKARLRAMPAFEVMNPVREIKPGASAVATATDDEGHEFPVLATQRFGRGRTAAMTIGDVWRWGMRNSAAREDMEKWWRQMLRWLVADVPEQVEVAVEQSPDDGSGAVKLQVRVRNGKFEAMDDASVNLEVTHTMSEDTNGPSGPIHLRAEPSSGEAGLYEASYVSRETGGYTATARVTNSVGFSLGQKEAGWSTDLAADEFRSLDPNIALLEDIARRTGGEMVAASGLDGFAKRLPTRSAPVMEPWTVPAWHTPLLFVLALACFVGEWGLRRWKGMP